MWKIKLARVITRNSRRLSAIDARYFRCFNTCRVLTAIGAVMATFNSRNPGAAGETSAGCVPRQRPSMSRLAKGLPMIVVPGVGRT